MFGDKYGGDGDTGASRAVTCSDEKGSWPEKLGDADGDPSL